MTLSFEERGVYNPNGYVAWRLPKICPRCGKNGHWNAISYVGNSGARFFCPHCSYTEFKS